MPGRYKADERAVMDRDRRLTGSLRGQTDNPRAPAGFELSNPWRVWIANITEYILGYTNLLVGRAGFHIEKGMQSFSRKGSLIVPTRDSVQPRNGADSFRSHEIKQPLSIESISISPSIHLPTWHIFVHT